MLSKICILGYILFVVGVFSFDNLLYIAIASFILLILMMTLPYSRLKTGAIPISLFLIVTFLANCFFNTGKIVIKLGPIMITEEGLYLASVRTLRVFLLISGAKFLTIITTIEEMIRALGSLFSPLEKLKIPVQTFFSTMALSVKVLPLIKQRLSDEYRSRMNMHGKKGLKERMSVVFQFLLPVFFESIHNPNSLFSSENMEIKKRDERNNEKK